MPALLRSRLTLLAVVGVFAAALPACGSDDAAENDAKDAQEQIEKNLDNFDDETKDAVKDAADEIEKGLEDIDGE